ncbi:hypothetical protein ACH4FX_36055 [Streptomyces sp. NPDC018019]|uniref:hypothetical protein n=1 Tax=Streptomyces sp. NPDC018019 TaxID=3365030 RepID=UPI0037B73FDA
MNLIGQLLPLVGVVLGAGTSFLVGAMNERRRWKREQAVRWDEARLNAYVEFAHIVKKLSRAYHRIAATRGLVTGIPPLELTAEVSAELSNDDDRRSVLVENLWLLGDPRTNAAARSMTEAVWRLEAMARGRQEADAGTWAVAQQDLWSARDEFRQAARATLSIESVTTLTSAG